MRVCFIVGEIFNWGVYGGFGKLTRTLGANLVKDGFEVFVLMPRISKDQRTIEILDGMTVVGLPSRYARSLYKACEADIYHSEDPSITTYLAMRWSPRGKHIVTFQDPMTVSEQILSIWSRSPRWKDLSFRLSMRVKVRISDFLVKRAVSHADALFSQAKYVIPTIATMFKLKRPPPFLPNPVEIPERSLKKADEPTVCFLARWDPVKRNEILFDLAKEFPEVKFIVPGKAHSEGRDSYLRETGRKLTNVEMPGFVSEEEKSRILEKSWVLVNTSLRECLPISFLEAAAHKCAILSSNDPDHFAKNFGYHVAGMDYAKGLKTLLENDAWKEKGERGFRYVKETHELGKVIDQHEKIYKEVVE
jgi:glycosyltransferase involved in cell wall biosynthesis